MRLHEFETRNLEETSSVVYVVQRQQEQDDESSLPVKSAEERVQWLAVPIQVFSRAAAELHDPD
jgi:hypothetical protein